MSTFKPSFVKNYLRTSQEEVAKLAEPTEERFLEFCESKVENTQYFLSTSAPSSEAVVTPPPAEPQHWSNDPAQARAVAAQLVKEYAPIYLNMDGYIILNAQEAHIIDALSTYPWGVVRTKGNHSLTSWGEPPPCAFYDLHCLISEKLELSFAPPQS